jgi:hypothetical protein
MQQRCKFERVVSFCDESLKILSDALTLFCHCFNDNVSQILILTIQPIHKPWLINDSLSSYTFILGHFYKINQLFPS